jgi:hypothetical protein
MTKYRKMYQRKIKAWVHACQNINLKLFFESSQTTKTIYASIYINIMCFGLWETTWELCWHVKRQDHQLGEK